MTAESPNCPGRGIYVSIPFCSQKCTYCNFASGVFGDAVRRDYLSALSAEIEQAGPLSDAETLYFGGGTPSLLSAAEFAGLAARLPVKAWLEATIEAAPGDADGDRIRAWAAAGVDRVSFGVQSFDPLVASRAGRKHSPEVIEREVRALRAAGIRRINMDLIAGLAHQTWESWRAEFEWLERLGVDHVSVYMLEVDDESRLGEELRAGGRRYGAQATPGEDQIAEFYEYAVERLRSMGVRRYEISNFARPGQESLHNLKYWTMQPYQGFGSDAHSFDGLRRWSNPATAPMYVDRWRNGSPSAVEYEPVTEERRLEERLMTGLRLTAGVEISDEDWARLADRVTELQVRGWLERSPGRKLQLTPAGALFCNEALLELLA